MVDYVISSVLVIKFSDKYVTSISVGKSYFFIRLNFIKNYGMQCMFIYRIKICNPSSFLFVSHRSLHKFQLLSTAECNSDNIHPSNSE